MLRNVNPWFVAFWFVVGLLLAVACGRPDPAAGQDVRRPQARDRREAPKDDAMYVWAMPDRGHQSLIVLNVVDGNTLDAAYLVPVRLRLAGVAAPALADKGGAEAKTAVEKLLGGHLRTAQLFGATPDGVVADFWVPPAKGEERGSWASAILLKQGVVKEK